MKFETFALGKLLLRQATDWEEISVIHASEKGLVFRAYEEHSKLNSKNTIYFFNGQKV